MTQEEPRAAKTKLAVHDPTIRHVQQQCGLGFKDPRIKRDRLLGIGDAEVRDQFSGLHGNLTFIVNRLDASCSETVGRIAATREQPQGCERAEIPVTKSKPFLS